MEVTAFVACAVIVFLLGMITGIWVLNIELRRNGWRVRLQVHERKEDPDP